MADFVPNENQQAMLEYLFETSEATALDITEKFPMRADHGEIEKQNYHDYVELWFHGLIGSRHKEWITNEGVVATSMRALRNPTNVN